MAVLSWTAPAFTAEPEVRRPAEPTPASADDGSVREVQPPVLYLRGKEGLLQAVLGFTLEDFERFMTQRAQLGLGQQPPKFQLQKLVCRGSAGEKHATLNIALDIAVNDRGWVRIPLRMREAVLRSQPKYKGPGEHLLEIDSATGDHILWLRGGSEEPHQVTLDVAAPLERVAGETELKLDLPRASLSQVTLSVPDPKATATVKEGALLEASTRAAKETEFKVLGAERGFTISWRKEGAEVAAVAPPQFEATGAIDVRLGARGVHSDVQLTVRGFTARFDSFRMRLQPGVTLKPDDQPGYTIERLAVEKKEQAAGEGQLHEVRIREPSGAPSVIRFSLDCPSDDGGAQPGFQIAGVELVGAARQAGHVAVRVDEDWQVAWGDLRQARRVDELPAELDHDGIIAGFEYFGQPFAIEGRLQPRETHITVDPRYAVEVTSGQARLEARLTYHIRGAKAFAVEVDLPGWELDDAEPRNVFDADRVTVETGKPLVIPLLQPTTGEITLVLRAHRALPTDAKRVEFNLPRPKADAVAPVHLAVTPAENVSLTLGDGSLQGLTRERAGAIAASGAIRPAAKGKQPLLFRGDSGELRFAAEMRVNSRVLWASVRSRLQLESERAAVEETIHFHVTNEPIDQLLLDAPRPVAELMEAGRLEISVDGTPLPAVPLEADAATSDEGADQEMLQRLRVSLPAPLLGACQLTLKYPLDVEPFAPGVGVPINVPLVTPADAEVSESEFEVVTGPGLRVQSRDDRWTVEPQAGAAPGHASVKLKSSVAIPNVVLSAHLEERKSHEPTAVQLAWFQTRLAGSERWERAVFQFTSGESQLPLKLPAGADLAQCRVSLDGANVVVPSDAERDGLLLQLAGATRRHVLDVSYRLATRDALGGRLSLSAPQIGSNLWIRQTYWQLVLPRDEHVVFWPSDLSGEFAWRLRGVALVRESTVGQRDLEAWSDAQTMPEVPTETNRYVFSAVGPIDSLEVYTAKRTWLVLLGSGSVLGLGLALLYLPKLRRPGLLWAGGLALAFAAIVCPEPALLAAQAALLGAVLVGLALVLHSFINRRQSQSFVVRAGSSSIIDPGSTRTHLRPSQPSGSSEPVVVEMSTSEGES
ncbi:MAG TPA: hypothetical protein VGJ26_00795 [Pirellulales bacterium]